MKDLAIIACVSKDLGLGQAGKLLWRIPEDMQFFKQTTIGGVVVMGRKTFASIGNPLPGRRNVVLSHQDLDTPGVDWCASKTDLDTFLATLPETKFIIGGASLYQMYLDEAETIYLTEIDATKPADTYFPEFNKNKYHQKVIKSGQQDDINYRIIEYTRKTLL